jgi:hypothetical protein
MRSIGRAGWASHGFFGFDAQTFGNPDGATSGGGAWQGVTNQGGDGAAAGLTPKGIRDGGANINGPDQGGGGGGGGGTVWTARSSPTTSEMLSITFGNNTFIAITADVPSIAVFSSDAGADWAESIAGLPGVQSTQISFGASTFMVACNGGGPLTFSTDNGLVWNTTTGTPVTGMAADSVAFSQPDGVWLALGSGTGPHNYAVSSNGGGIWIQPADFTNSGWDFNALIWDGTQFVALGTPLAGGAAIYTSADGSHWVETVLPDTTRRNSPVAFGAGNYMIGNGAATTVRVATTPAGLATAADLPVTFNPITGDASITTVLYDPAGPFFIAFGDGGGVSTSTDLGVTWTPGTLNFSAGAECRAAAYGNGMVVAVSTAGDISTLP